ncbi:M20/M25/M40 family metallo-hydrolase, partial [Ralstonia solanacearum]
MKPSRLALAALLLCAAPLSHADANPKVLAAAEHYRSDALQLLERLVNIDSGTGNEAGLSRLSAIVVDELRKTGAQVETVSAAPAVGNNVLATWRGTGKARILLMAHMDTVFKDGTARAKPFYIKDQRAYGPGVMDDKGGVVAALYAMKILQQLDFRQYGQVTLLLNTNEETGSKGTRALIEREAGQH